MKIHDQLIEILKSRQGTKVHSKDIEEELNKKYGTNKKSILISDRCYNRFNDGLKNDFSKRIHLFEYLKDGEYKYLGKDYKYTGKIVHKPKASRNEIIVGEWKDGKLIMNDEQIKKLLTKKDKSKIDNKNALKLKQKLENYQPKNTVDIEILNEFKNEIDYIENHRKLMEIGNLAEQIVLKNEIEFLKIDYPELAEKVRLVSNDPKLGFDILSFETDGKQKQIEVKAISVYKNTKSFIITRNEFSKSKIYSNYYVYCVTEVNSAEPKILRIKNPDFENEGDFLIEPLTYKITFE